MGSDACHGVGELGLCVWRCAYGLGFHLQGYPRENLGWGGGCGVLEADSEPACLDST